MSSPGGRDGSTQQGHKELWYWLPIFTLFSVAAAIFAFLFKINDYDKNNFVFNIPAVDYRKMPWFATKHKKTFLVRNGRSTKRRRVYKGVLLSLNPKLDKYENPWLCSDDERRDKTHFLETCSRALNEITENIDQLLLSLLEWAPVVGGAVLLLFLLSRLRGGSAPDPCKLNPDRLKYPTGGRKSGGCT